LPGASAVPLPRTPRTPRLRNPVLKSNPSTPATIHALYRSAQERNRLARYSGGGGHAKQRPRQLVPGAMTSRTFQRFPQRRCCPTYEAVTPLVSRSKKKKRYLGISNTTNDNTLARESGTLLRLQELCRKSRRATHRKLQVPAVYMRSSQQASLKFGGEHKASNLKHKKTRPSNPWKGKRAIVL
jgi:hypothetical protein